MIFEFVKQHVRSCFEPSECPLGNPVRVWGLLAAGRLRVTILPAGAAMNRDHYVRIITNHFDKWLRDAFGDEHKVFLVQDHERCLWAKESRDAIRAVGLTLLDNFPKSSQDLNPIECVWNVLRDRKDHTTPRCQETREEFISRLRVAVAWVNRNHSAYLTNLCACQRGWALDVLQAKGARTKH